MPTYRGAGVRQEGDGMLLTQTVEDDENSSSDEGDGVDSVSG